VILTVPHTPETERFMNRARFREMTKTAFFINIGRGMTTRLDDLVEAWRAREIVGAGLDVFEQEPLPADHKLWTMPGVLLTPHTAGYGPYLDDRRYEIILDNCRRFLAASRCATRSTRPAGSDRGGRARHTPSLRAGRNIDSAPEIDRPSTNKTLEINGLRIRLRLPSANVLRGADRRRPCNGPRRAGPSRLL
jgi:D-isomer specific 2-hydroxyacid dehydrogenase-like protein